MVSVTVLRSSEILTLQAGEAEFRCGKQGLGFRSLMLTNVMRIGLTQRAFHEVWSCGRAFGFSDCEAGAGSYCRRF